MWDYSCLWYAVGLHQGFGVRRLCTFVKLGCSTLTPSDSAAPMGSCIHGTRTP